MHLYKMILALLLFFGTAFSALDPRLEQGARFAAAGEHEKAIAEYSAILATDPNNAQAYLAAADVRFKIKDYSRALANYRLAYRYAPRMSEAYEGAAKIYEALGDKKGAAAERAKDPANQPAVVEESPVEATPTPVATPTPAAVATPTPPPVVTPTPVATPTPAATEASSKYSYDGSMFLKGKELFAQKKHKEAAPIWRDVLVQQPGHPGAYYYAGVARYEMNELDKAEFNLKRAFDYPELGYNAHYYLSLIYKKQKKTDLEKVELELYLAGAPSSKASAVAAKRLAELTTPVQEQVTAEQLPAAVENKVVEVPAENKAKDAAAALLDDRSIEVANAAFLKGDLGTALSIYREWLDKKPSEEQHSFALLKIGNIYRERRDFRSAVAKYREIVESFPNSDWANEAERAWEEAVWQEKNAAKLPRQNKR